VAEGSSSDVDTAVAAARAAFPAWSALSPAQRGLPLRRLAELVAAATPEIAMLDALSLGRPVGAYFDAHYATTQFAYFAQAAYPVARRASTRPASST